MEFMRILDKANNDKGNDDNCSIDLGNHNQSTNPNNLDAAGKPDNTASSLPNRTHPLYLSGLI